MPNSPYYKILPGEGGHFTVVDRDGRPVFSGQDFRSPLEAVNAISGLAMSSGQDYEVVHTQEGAPPMVILEGARRPGASKQGVILQLSISPELDALLDNMAEELGATKGEAILKALGLLKIALDARRDQKHLGILDENLELDQEIEL